MTGEELAAKRERAGLTQVDLAGYLGIGRTSVWRLETGKEEIKRPVEALAQTLELGNSTLEKWMGSLPLKKRQAISRRQLKINLRAASIRP